MKLEKDGYILSTDNSLLQFDRIHHFLSKVAYWSLGIPRETVQKAAAHSLCFGLYYQAEQVGYARVVTDETTFAWLCDVYVEENHRGKGLSKWMMSCILAYPTLQNLRRISLATKDAHGLYHQFGFQMSAPDRMMEIKKENAYS